MRRKIDISGEWEGRFRYDRVFPETPFTLTLRERGGVLTGIVREPRLATMNRFGSEIEARIAGLWDQHHLSWRKEYQGDYYRSIVHYVGALSEDGTTISGRWNTGSQWTGPFEMVRLSRRPMAAMARRRLFRTAGGD